MRKHILAAAGAMSVSVATMAVLLQPATALPATKRGPQLALRAELDPLPPPPSPLPPCPSTGLQRAAVATAGPSSARRLSFPGTADNRNQSASFKVLVITDTHLLDNQGVAGNESNVSAASTRAVATLLDLEKPHLLVHNGDVVSGEAANRTDDVVRAVRQIFQPVVDRNIPFAKTGGNHDNDRFSTHASITRVEREMAGDLSLTGSAPSSLGGGEVASDTYYLPVYPSSDAAPDSKPSFLIWFFDSRSGKTANGSQIEDWVLPSTSRWIEEQSSDMKRRWTSMPPSLVFTHIPTHDFVVTQTQPPHASEVGGVLDETPKNFTSWYLRYPGLNDDNPVSTQGSEDGRNYTGQDRAWLNAFTQGATGEARIYAIVSGHNHGADWCAPSSLVTPWSRQDSKLGSPSPSSVDSSSSGAHGSPRPKAVPLCFAKHSGFGGYDYDNWNHGARVFEVASDGSVQTWIRMLTGEKRYLTNLVDGF